MNIFKITHYSNITMMLLGRGEGQFLKLRKETKKKLIETGFKDEKIIIMEDFKNEPTDLSFENKFRRILKKHKPHLFIAFFHKKQRMDGVTFELGWLCCKYSLPQLGKRLRVFAEADYNWNYTTGYISSLFPYANLVPLRKYDSTSTSQQINNWVNGVINSQF